ncbi:hypothetical protein PM033_17745, partial [Halorubrum ezzemoulense]|uniref:hypothetical protein n=1 Tax=Halorubrum ezzemoulense TaxID=337243 RepID=UPI00232D759F
MSTPPGLVLASAVSPVEQRIFSEIVQRGLDRSLGSTIDAPGDDRMAHAYPVPADDDINKSAIEAGDYVLFYTGSNQYTFAAQVLEVTHQREVVAGVIKRGLRESVKRAETDSYAAETLLWLDIPIPIELQSFTLHD